MATERGEHRDANTPIEVGVYELVRETDGLLAKDEIRAVGIVDIGVAGASLCGCAIVIEKGYQGGGDELRAKGIRVDSLAIVDSMTETSLTFR